MATFKLFNNHLKTSFLLLAGCEGLIFFGSVLASTAIRFNTVDIFSSEVEASVDNLIYKAIVFAVIHLLGMTALGQYQREQYRGQNSFKEMFARVVVSMMFVSVALLLIYYILPSISLGRGIAVLAFLISLASIITLRQLFFLMVDGNVFVTRVLILGTGEQAASLMKLTTDPSRRPSFNIKGFISIPSESVNVPEEMVINPNKSLLELARKLRLDEIILAMDDRRKGYPTQELIDCKMAGIRILDPVTFLEREQGKVNLKMMNPSWMIYSDGFTASQLKGILSRLFDVIASLSILVVTSPILLVTAFLISMEGGFKEPVFYRQVRVGKDGKQFFLLKFRSMRVDAEKSGAQWAAKNDARVTKVGAFIRKCRIDELPQIINILKGDMRLVGPRPERPEFVSKLSESFSMYKQRHSVKPGLAGWAQLKYPYGASEEDAYEKLQYDLFYIKNANLVMDIFILLQTLEVVIFGKGVR